MVPLINDAYRRALAAHCWEWVIFLVPIPPGLYARGRRGGPPEGGSGNVGPRVLEGPPGGGLEGNQEDGEGGRGVTLLFVTRPGLALSDTGKCVTGQVVCS